MAGVSTGYDQSIRSLLNQKGVDNSRIGYNPQAQTVQVDGRDFMKAPKVYQNTAYTNQQGFNTAYDAFNKPSVNQYGATGAQPGASAQPSQGSPATGAGAATDGYTYKSPYQPAQANPADAQYNQLLTSLLQSAQNPYQTDVNSIYASPQYAAYQAQAQKAAQEGIRAAQESMGASGFGRSSALAERSQGIQNDADTYLQTQVLPQLIAADQASHQQQLQNQFGLLDALYGQQQLYDTRGQNAESNALQRGQLVGTYISPEMQSLYDAVLQDKQAYAGAQSPEERQQIRADADSLRQRIYAMGGDPSLVGSDVTLDQAGANAPKFGIQTNDSRRLALEEQDRIDEAKQREIENEANYGGTYKGELTADQALKQRAAALNETQIMAVLTGYLPDGTPTSAQQQLELENQWKAADELGVVGQYLGSLYGIPEDTPTQAAKVQAAELAISQQNANTSAYNASTSRMSAINSNENADANTALARDKFEYEKKQDEEKPKEDDSLSASPTEVNQLLENYQLTGQDSNGKRYKYVPSKGTPDRTNWALDTVESLVDAGYDNATIQQVLRAAGINKAEEDEIFK